MLENDRLSQNKWINEEYVDWGAWIRLVLLLWDLPTNWTTGTVAVLTLAHGPSELPWNLFISALSWNTGVKCSVLAEHVFPSLVLHVPVYALWVSVQYCRFGPLLELPDSPPQPPAGQPSLLFCSFRHPSWGRGSHVGWVWLLSGSALFLERPYLRNAFSVVVVLSL